MTRLLRVGDTLPWGWWGSSDSEESASMCMTSGPSGYVCTMPRDHMVHGLKYPWHVAGTAPHESIVAVWDASAMSPAVLRVGDPNPTAGIGPEGGRCNWPFSTGGVCTWPENHAHPQHVASAGTRIRAVADVTAAEVVYSRRDPDPTPNTVPVNREPCRAPSPSELHSCTWMAGRDHPAQHVAGNGRTIMEVWEYA